MKPENSIRNKKVELAVSSVVFLYAANIVWYFLTGVFEWGDPLGVYLIFIANGILGLILYVAVSLICYRKIKISPKNNRVLRICLIIITGIFFVWLVLFRLLPNFERYKERVAARSFLSHPITTISEMVADYFICLLCGI